MAALECGAPGTAAPLCGYIEARKIFHNQNCCIKTVSIAFLHVMGYRKWKSDKAGLFTTPSRIADDPL